MVTAPGLGVWIGIAAISIALGIACESRAHACSCVQPPSPRAAAAEATAVFEGRTFGVHREGGKVRFTFEVSRVFKGEVGPTIDVQSASSSAACGRSFEAGLQYLVYARTSPGGMLVDSLCTRTRASRSAVEDFTELGAGTPPPRPDAPSAQRPSVEAPRIEPTTNFGAGPPVAAPSKRGCAIDGDVAFWWPLLAVLAVPRRRRLSP